MLFFMFNHRYLFGGKQTRIEIAHNLLLAFPLGLKWCVIQNIILITCSIKRVVFLLKAVHNTGSRRTLTEIDVLPLTWQLKGLITFAATVPARRLLLLWVWSTAFLYLLSLFPAQTFGLCRGLLILKFQQARLQSWTNRLSSARFRKLARILWGLLQ